MATNNRILQLLRTSAISNNKAAAITYVQGQTVSNGIEPKDGEIRLARYWYPGVGETGAVVKSLICVYHASPNLPNGTTAGWTFIEDASNGDAGLGGLQNEVDAIETGVGLGVDGSYTAPSGTNYLGSTTSVVNALTALDTAIDGIADDIADMDLTEVGGTSGDVITAVSQADGQVSASASALTDVLMTGYAKDTNATGAIAATDTVEEAFSKLENAIGANKVTAGDASITMGTDSTNGNDTVAVNIKSGEKVLALDSTANAGGLYTDIKIAKVVTSGNGTGADGAAAADEYVGTLGTNVKEAYVLKATDGTALGKQINIYNDSALQEVYLGASTDTINSSTGVITKNTVTDPQSMNFAYQLADGTYSLVKIDVSKFLTESEYGDGLSVSNTGVISVKYGDGLGFSSTADTDGKKKLEVVIDSTNDSNNYLSVGANGVALDGDAIDTAISNAATASATQITEKNTSATADTNDKYIKVVKTAGTNGDPDSYLVTTTGIDTAITTAIEALDGSATATAASGDVYTVLTGVSQTDGVISKASEVTLAAVAKTGDAADVSYTNTTSSLTATTVQTAIDEVEGRVDTLETNALTGVTAGNDGIEVGTASNNSQSVSLKLSSASDNALAINATSGSEGLYLSNTWDCGTY